MRKKISQMRILTFALILFSINIVYSQTLLKDINPGDGNTFLKQTITTSDRIYIIPESSTYPAKCHIYNIAQDSLSSVLLPNFRNNNSIFIFKNEVYVLGFQNFQNTILYKIDTVDYSLDVVYNFGTESTNREISEVIVGENVVYMLFASPNQQWVTKGTSGTTSLIDSHTNSNIKFKKLVGNKLFYALQTSWYYSLIGLYEDTYWSHFYGNFKLGSFNNMESLNGELFFSGSLETEGNNFEPWKTSLNTVARMQELSSGSSGSYPFNFRKFGNKVLFNANGNELYATDGSTTDFLANVTMSGEGSENNGIFYFSGNQSSSGFEPWKTNGNSAGTQLIQELKVGTDSGIENLTFPKSTFSSVGDKAIFRGVSAINGKELFLTDGSIVNLLKEFSPGTANSFIGEFYNIGNKVIFLAANSLEENRELYVSDGTPNGTVPLASLFTSFPISQTYPIKKGSNYFLFQAFNNTIGYELFIYFLNTNSVKLLKNVNINKRGISYNPTNQSFAFKIGQKQLFFANDSEHGNELWVTDGDSSNTFLLKDFTKQAYKLNGQFLELTGDYRTNTFVNSIYADDNFAILVINGNEVWKINNNLTLENLYKSDIFSSPFFENNNPIFKDNGRFFFLLNNNNWYTTDGTALGTYAIANQFTVKRILGKLGNDLIFYANDNLVGDEVFKLDLTTLGITLLKDINPGWQSSISFNSYSSTIGNSIVFIAFNDTYGHEFWVTDGTISGTQLLKDINNLSQSSMDQGFVYGRIGNAIIFSANTENGLSLWRTDGTTNGTFILKDLNSTSTYEIFSYVNYNLDSTHIIFLANDYTNGYEPFITDGTSEGTKMISNYSSGPNSSELSFNNNAVKVQNDIYFVISGNKLVRYNTITSSIYTFNTNFHYPLYFFKNNNQVYVMIAENLIYPTRIIKLYKITGNTLELVSSDQLNTSVNYIPVVKPFFNQKDKFFFALDADNNEEIYFYKFCRDILDINMSNISIQNSANEYITSGMVLTQTLVNFSAGKAIDLSPGFQTSMSGVFKAEIKGCQ